MKKIKKSQSFLEQLVIKKYPLPGQEFNIKVHGSKNCALPIVMYTFLVGRNNEIKLRNIPPITDVKNTLELFRAMGGVYKYDEKKNELIVKEGIKNGLILKKYIERTRISVLLMSILLVKFGKIAFPKEIGGCNLGSRPLNYHLEVFKQLGCSIVEKQNEYLITREHFAKSKIINFPKETTTGTENALFFANFNSKNTLIKKAHLRPEILELIKFMNQLGAVIGIDNGCVLINKNQQAINNQKLTFTVIDDMEEALSYIALGFATDSFYKIKFTNPYRYEEFETLIALSQGSLTKRENFIVQKPYRARKHQFIKLATGPYPGFSSDAQPIMAAILLKISESFQIDESRFKGRFKYYRYFKLLGINCEHNRDSIKVKSTKIGPSKQNYKFIAYDLRTAMNAILTASISRRKITLVNSEIILRGYANFFNTLRDIGFELEKS